MYSVIADDPSILAAREVAEAIARAPVVIHPLRASGRNSRIYRVNAGGRSFALKQYPPRRDDPRDRLSTEVGALRLMAAGHIDVIPQVIGVDRERNYVMLSWIDGAPVEAISDADIDAAIAVLFAIHSLRNAPGAAVQPLASEACLSGAEIERQIRERLSRLDALTEESELKAFLRMHFLPELERALAKGRTTVAAAGLDFTTDLPQECRSLVPADFGFHNSLRRPDGSLAFVDFEYFGWDDPVKLTSDVILHPGQRLATAQRAHLRRGAEGIYWRDGTFAVRLAAYLPLFALRWSLILLNEFIPERWDRRRLAGATESWDEAKRRQLGRARDMLSGIAGGGS
jgi:hypothetical protein